MSKSATFQNSIAQYIVGKNTKDRTLKIIQKHQKLDFLSLAMTATAPQNTEERRWVQKQNHVPIPCTFV